MCICCAYVYCILWLVKIILFFGVLLLYEVQFIKILFKILFIRILFIMDLFIYFKVVLIFSIWMGVFINTILLCF